MLGYFVVDFIELGALFGILCLISGCLIVQNWRGGLAGLGIGLALALIPSTLGAIEYNHDKNDFNNGYCTECQVKYEFINSFSSGRFGMVYHSYQCPKCEKVIEILPTVE